MRTGDAGLNLIKGFEGLRLQSYYSPTENWSVGYGHTDTARHGMAVSEDQAEILLRQDVIPIEQVIDETVMAPLNRNEHDALVSFIYNIGEDNFRRSEVLRRLNAGDRLGAADAMEKWSRARVGGELVRLDGLVRRRAAEKSLFLMPVDSEVVIPSSDIRPADDCESAGASEFKTLPRAIEFDDFRGDDLSDEERSIRAQALYSASQAIARDPSKMIITRAEEKADWGVTAGVAMAGLGGVIAVLLGVLLLVGLEQPGVASVLGLSEDQLIRLFDRLPVWLVGIGAATTYFIAYVLVKRAFRHDLKLRRTEELARYQLLD